MKNVVVRDPRHGRNLRGVPARGWRLVGAFLRITRIENCVLAGTLVYIGALSGRSHAASLADAALASLMLGLAVAAANVHNDVVDAAADALFKGHRPIPSGQLSAKAAACLGWCLGTGAIACSLALPGSARLYAITCLALSTAYNKFFKGVPFVGNLIVASLAGSTVVVGSLTSGPLQVNSVFICFYILLGMLAVETVKTIEDAIDDAFAALRTLAHKISEETQRRYLRVLIALFSITCLLMLMCQTGTIKSLLLMPALCMPALPLAQLSLVRRWERPRIQQALRSSKLLWPASAACLLFMVQPK